MAKIACVVFIAVYVGIAMGELGQVTACNPSGGLVPILVYWTLLTAMILGYLAGLEDR